jgi:hypothetical protein
MSPVGVSRKSPRIPSRTRVRRSLRVTDSRVSLAPDDRPGPRGTSPAADTPPTIVVRPGGFDWADAGIGAGAAVGVGLLGAGILAASARRRKVAAT